ncbi:MAG: hypothetical protein ACI4LX_08225 [Treponema sp.]
MEIKRNLEDKDSQNLLNDSKQFYDRITFDIKQSEKDRLKGAISASMGAGNPKGSRLSPNDELKDAINSVLKEMLTEIVNTADLSKEKYDELFYKTLYKLEAAQKEKDSGCWMLFGRLQKIINIYIKYHIVLSFLDKKFKPYQKLIPVVHIPIDRIVLDWFKLKKNNPDKEDRDTVKNVHSWKRDLQENNYKQIQAIARKISEQNKITPFELEMKIWLERI